MAPFSSCTHIAMTARSNLGSAIPGIARSNLPDRKLGCSTTLQPWAGGTPRARLEAAIRRAYLPLHPHATETFHDDPSWRPPARRATRHWHIRGSEADHQRG